MAFEIVLKKRFLYKVTKTLSYLEQEWSHAVAAAFLQNLTEESNNLQNNHS